MEKRKLHTKLHNQRGFTLVEVLLSIAILGVLVAIAMPSIFSIQKSMQMVELDSGANQIALAAQNRMTSMKVSGTWLPALDEYDGKKGDASKIASAKNLPADAGTDIFYLTAQQAKDLKIISPLSIDETVYNSDFIIEFKKSTASVCGVFFADGREGFFSNTQIQDGAKKYYDAMTDAAAREPSARLKASPLVGYYWGTPAGATEAVALRNPNIWVDESGMLCIENVNETDHPEWNTSVQATIETKDGTGKFVLGGMQENGTTYGVSLAEDSSSSEPFDNEGIYELIARDGNATSPVNVYQIDLNKLLEVLKKDGSADLKKQLEAFAPGVDIKVTAQVKAANKPSIPATATAFVVWPEEVAKLNVLATAMSGSTNNNYSVATEREANQTKTIKSVSMVDRDCQPLDYPPQETAFLEEISIQNASPEWEGYEPEANTQFYKGIKVASQKVDGTVLFEIKPGNVTKWTPSGNKYYYYQVFEIWVNNTLVGSVQGVTWKWNDKLNTEGLFLEKAKNKKLQPIVDTMPTLSADNPSIYLDPAKLKESGIVSAEEDCTVYIRSAPAMKDVESYLNYNVGNTPGDASSRAIDDLSRAWGTSFFGEFRTPSSVALWAIKQGKIPGISASKDNDICYYYAPTPFAKGQDPMAGKPLASSVMWALESVPTGEYNFYKYKPYHDYLAVGQDYSGVVPSPAGLGEVTRPQVDPLGSADFAIQTDTPELYYRSITYCNAEGIAYPNTPAQWEPIVGFNVVEGQPVTNDKATFAPEPEKIEDYAFVGWNTEKDGSGQRFSAGDKLIDYRNSLPLGPVVLYAQYIKVSVGIMYLEFDDNEKTQVSGYHGYLDEKGDVVSLLPKDNVINAWDYCVVVPANTATPTVAGFKLGNQLSVTIADTKFDAYSLTEPLGVDVKSKKDHHVSLVVSAKNGNVSKKGTFYVNFNFAAAVEKDSTRAEAWGGRNDSEAVQSSNAWKVRFATQFPGALYSLAGGSIQTSFVGDCYVQTHDIDMADVARKLPPNTTTENFWFRRLFTGVYDGGSREGFVITGFETRFEKEVEHALGLFPRIENAVLENIDLTFEQNTEHAIIWNKYGSIDASFGCLVGTAENSTIEACSVRPAKNEDNGEVKQASIILSITNVPANFDNNIGCLVGWSKGTSIQDVSVKSTTLEISSYGNKKWESNRSQRFGSVVGYIDASSLGDSFAFEEISSENATVNVEVLSTKDISMALGGLVGFLETGENACLALGWRTDDVLMRAPIDQDVLNLAAGGMVGIVTGVGISLDPASNNSCFATDLSIGGDIVPLTDISKWIGKSL